MDVLNISVVSSEAIDVLMLKHDAFRKAGGTGSVKHDEQVFRRWSSLYGGIIFKG